MDIVSASGIDCVEMGVKGGTKWRKYMKTCMFLCFHVNFKHESTKNMYVFV